METREIKEKVLRIMALAVEVSTIHEYPHGGDYPDVFVEFSAHVSCLSVTVYENGFDASVEPDKRWNAYLYRDDTPDSSKADNYFGYDVLDEIIGYLEGLKNA